MTSHTTAVQTEMATTVRSSAYLKAVGNRGVAIEGDGEQSSQTERNQRRTDIWDPVFRQLISTDYRRNCLTQYGYGGKEICMSPAFESPMARRLEIHRGTRMCVIMG